MGIANSWASLPWHWLRPNHNCQHAALRLTARGWETNPLRAPDGSGSFVVALDLRTHETLIETSRGDTRRVSLLSNRSVGAVTQEVLAQLADLVGPIDVNLKPQEVPWEVTLDNDEEHAHYAPSEVANYFAAATQVALILAEFRAPYRGRSTPVNAWWGSFDLAVNMFSGREADPPSQDFIMRNAMDAQEVAFGWWPGDRNYTEAAFYAYAHPAPAGFAGATLSPGQSRWEADLGEYVLDWKDVCQSSDPAGDGPRVRAFGVPSRLRGLRLGSSPPGECRRFTATDYLTAPRRHVS